MLNGIEGRLEAMEDNENFDCNRCTFFLDLRELILEKMYQPIGNEISEDSPLIEVFAINLIRGALKNSKPALMILLRMGFFDSPDCESCNELCKNNDTEQAEIE